MKVALVIKRATFKISCKIDANVGCDNLQAGEFMWYIHKANIRLIANNDNSDIFIAGDDLTTL